MSNENYCYEMSEDQTNEQKMKERGELRIEKELINSHGNKHKLASMQLAQQLVIDEADRLADDFIRWINEDTAKADRKVLQAIFSTREETIDILTSVILFMFGSIRVTDNLINLREKIETKRFQPQFRHTLISSIDRHVFGEKLGFDRTWRCIEQIVDSSRYFEAFSWNEGTQLRQIYTCNINEKMSEILWMKKIYAFYPLPMTEKPLDWFYDDVAGIVGGYREFQQPLIRIKGSNVDYSRYSQNIFDTVNYIQSIPWRVNREVLVAVERDLKEPKWEDYVKTKFPEKIHIESASEEVLEEYYEAIALYNAEAGDYESAVGKWRATKNAINIAYDYLDQDIYFPHNYDFRGRIYPIPIGLSPQGSDAVKALLEFAEGEVLNEDGANWCYAYLASLYGDDKISFIERVKRGKELLHTDYHEADEPYQFLAHQIELQRYEKDHLYPVKTRIHLDACNSGSQFTSAITGDLKGCQVTNVIPHPEGKREDAYLEVANTTVEALKPEEKCEDEAQIFFYNLLLEKGRKICKRPVMVSNYGGTAGGRTEIIYNMFRELDLDRKWITRKYASQLAKVIGESINGVLVGGKAFEKYIHAMCTVIAKKGQSIEWITPDGFYVKHVKYEEKKSQISVKLKGRVSRISRIVFTDKVTPRKMRSAVSPNYIHSLDAMLLRNVALQMKRRGVRNTSWIHDSFGTTPNNTSIMLDITKREFIKLIRNQPLRALDEQLKHQARQCKVHEKDLNKIQYPQLKGFHFRNGLNCLMKSEWFFS